MTSRDANLNEAKFPFLENIENGVAATLTNVEIHIDITVAKKEMAPTIAKVHRDIKSLV